MVTNKMFWPMVLLLISAVAPGQIQFAPYEAHATISDSKPVCLGDVNNDGLPDAVIATSVAHFPDISNNYKIFVYLQNTQGQLELPVKYDYHNTSSVVDNLKIKDLNNDGRNDVAVAYQNKIGVLYQNASGTLDDEIVYTCSDNVATLGVGDFNGDGLNDMVVSNSAATIEVLLQQADGTFLHQFYPRTSYFVELEVTDMNDDGKDDLVFLGALSSAGFSIYLQNENGTFDPAMTRPNVLAEAGFLSGFGVGDLNNDGLKDVAITTGGNSPNAKILLLYQNPLTHVFENPLVLSAYDIPEPLEIADLNNDGKNEIVTLHGGWLKASVYSQNNSGMYGNYQLFNLPYASHYATQGLVVGDLNSDNGKDLIIGDYGNGLIVLYNTSTLANTSFDVEETSINLYPNPAKSEVNLDFGNLPAQEATVTLYNLNGQLLYDQKVDTRHVQPLNLQQFPAGIYQLKIYLAQQSITKKLIIK